MKRVLVFAAVALAGCGGGGEPRESPEAAVKAWAAALNAGDGEKVCDLSEPPCEPDSTTGYEGDPVTYEGPASNGNPDDLAFSLHAGRRTLMVTAVPRQGGYLVRFDAVIER